MTKKACEVTFEQGKKRKRKKVKEEKEKKMELTRLFSFFYFCWGRRGHHFDRVSRGIQLTNVLLLIFFPHLPNNKGKICKLSEWILNDTSL
jgi:hypothetical protein